jgi:trk system potassium uptake protein TrkH
MGITPNLEPLSKLLLVLLMFAGRLGPLTLMDVFEHLPQPPPVRYATEELVIG